MLYFVCSLSRKEPNARHTGRSSRRSSARELLRNITRSSLACRCKPILPCAGCCGIKFYLIGNACSNRSRVTWVANNKHCQLANKNYAQTFASRKLSCTRHSINKFILCARLRELSSHNGLHTAGLSAVSLTVPVLFLELPMLVRTAPCVFIGAH